MPRVCLTCGHPDREAIDRAIIQNVAYTRIASKWGLGAKSVERHAKEHVSEQVQAAQAAIAQNVVNNVREFSEHVYYELPDKIYDLQDRIYRDIKATATMPERIPLYRELRGVLQEQAKISGAYVNPADNPTTIANAITAYQDWAMDNPDATPEEQRVWLSKFASQAKVTPETLAEKVQAIPGVQ